MFALRGFTDIVMSEAAIGIIDGNWLLRNVTIGNDANTSVVNLILFNLQARKENYRVSNLYRMRKNFLVTTVM